MDYKDYLLQENKENHFWYKSRKILIDELFSFFLNKKHSNRKILDIGCGTGTDLDLISKYGELYAVDVNKEAVEIARGKGFQVDVADLEREDLGNNQNDVVSAFDVLEHIENDNFAIKNIFQTLKTPGIFIFSVPVHKVIFSQHDIAMEHKRRYSKKEIREKLKKVGFKSIELYYWNFTLFPFISLMRVFKNIFSKNIKPDSEAKNRNVVLNNILFTILKIEAKYFFRKKTPPGLSIYGVARKK